LWIAAIVACPTDEAKVLRVGAAAEVITPPVGMPMAVYYFERAAEGVHDDLYAKKYPEAQPPMLSGYEGLKAREPSIPVPNRGCLAEAAKRIAALYTAWGKPEKAAEWKAKK
jgi:hypothetical protein